MDANLGPTVAEYAEKEIKRLNMEIEELTARRKYYNWLLLKYLDSKLLYSEYVADKAEAYQKGIL